MDWRAGFLEGGASSPCCRVFEHVGKAIFCGNVKRRKKEHEAPEAEDETEKDAPANEVDESGRACRQKGWWKRGDVEAKVNTVNMTAWVHKECDIMEEEALRECVLFIGTQFSILYTY
jgi:hypothetical protein